MGDRELYEATRLQYLQRTQGKPYLSPDRMPEHAKKHSSEAAELAELIYQIKNISWKKYVIHAGKLVSRPELAYDYVKRESSALDNAVKSALSKTQKKKLVKLIN